MYMLTEVEKVVRIPPKDLKDDIDSVIDNLTWETYEGRLGEDKNFTLLIRNVRTVGPGRIVHGDGAVYQTVKFDQVVFRPRDNEIIEGVVVEILKFGAFVRFGPLDGLLHISQVMDDRVDIDETNQRLVGKDTGRFLAVGAPPTVPDLHVGARPDGPFTSFEHRQSHLFRRTHTRPA